VDGAAITANGLTDAARRVAHASTPPRAGQGRADDRQATMVIAPVLESIRRGSFVSGLGAGPDTTRAS